MQLLLVFNLGLQDLKSNINFFCVVALDKTTFSSCLHFLMETLKFHVIQAAPLGRVTTTNNFLCLLMFV